MVFDPMKFLGAVLTGGATATGVHLAGQMMPGSYGVKLAAQVGTTAAVTGALHVAGAPDHIRDAAAIGGGAVVVTRVADELSLYQSLAKLREGGTSSSSSSSTGNNAAGNSTTEERPTQGLYDRNPRRTTFDRERTRAGVPV